MISKNFLEPRCSNTWDCGGPFQTSVIKVLVQLRRDKPIWGVFWSGKSARSNLVFLCTEREGACVSISQYLRVSRWFRKCLHSDGPCSFCLFTKLRDLPSEWWQPVTLSGGLPGKEVTCFHVEFVWGARVPDLEWSKTLGTDIQSAWLCHNPTLLKERCRRKKTTVHITLIAQKWIERIFRWLAQRRVILFQGRDRLP